MARGDAQIVIDGGIVADPRWNQTQNGQRVGNLTVRAGRSKYNEQTQQWEQLSSTAYDVAAWNEVHDALATQNPLKGSQVSILGTVTGLDSYTDQNGAVQLTAKVTASAIHVWPPKQQGGFQGQQGSQQGGFSGQGGYGSPQGQQAPQGAGYGGQPGYDAPPF
ncbi:single-stranded DNA-binding protein [Brachybacterium sp. NPDC056505]|uniref:single-stranded DNA-binding protein n=1 Tax=Brachybacterium sp. NPDC056505 TaxID=3345843 RepID=UPI00366FF8AF